MNLESVYLRLPTFAQNLVCSGVGWRIQRTRFGANFLAHLLSAKERSHWSQEQIVEFRDRRLRAFIKHCATTVPYYQALFAEVGLDPDKVRTLDDLSALPVLTKPVVQARYAELLSTAVPARKRIMTHTSGTTGGGLRFAVTMDALNEQWAVWTRFRQWHKLELDVWQGYFGGRSVVPLTQRRPPYWRYNWPGRQILFSGYHMSPATMDDYVELLRRRKPPWLHGYPSLLALLASHMIERGISLEYPLGWVTTSAENLLPQQVGLIERAFQVRPLQHYGMAEGVANISQCPRGKLHVDEGFAAVEFLPLPQGGCRVVGTNLSNPATPLVRYEVGDVVDYVEGDTCDCGLPGRIVRSVDGRQEDYVILRNGARLGRMDHIFKDLMAIREAQIYQDEPGELVVRVVKNANYTADDESDLLREFHKRVGDEATVRVVYVDRIQRTDAGKIRFVVSNVRSGKLVPALCSAENNAVDAPSQG